MTLRKKRNWNDPGNWVLPDVLENLADDRGEADFTRPAQVLAQYFQRRPDGRVLFSGARFDRLGRSDDASTINRFTAEDLVAVSMLSVNVPANAALALTGDSGNDIADDISKELKKLPPTLSLAEAQLRTTVNGIEERGAHYLTMRRLWRLVTRFTVERSGGEKTGVGETRASKLLARKRPHLFPVIDDVLKKTLAPGDCPDYVGDNFWVSMQDELTKDNGRLLLGLYRIRQRAGELLKPIQDDSDLSDISVLRVFDVIVWMTGKGYKPEDWKP
ncbi:DUF6308 family protein [Corynebacterium sp. NPDC060344]|uniref:DUF6308 family protein n=1 Tax=Corynebacterium sp. NPDC060344 TaxID=3347101 RepID=UPI0036502796